MASDISRSLCLYWYSDYLNHDRSHQATLKLLKSFGWGNLATDINNKYLMINNGQLGQIVHVLTVLKIYFKFIYSEVKIIISNQCKPTEPV